MEPTAKIDLKPTLLLEAIYNPISWNMPWELCPKVCWMNSGAQ